jgi:cytochrome P450
MANKSNKTPTAELLSEAQARAAQLIASGRSGRSVAGELGVHPSTLSGWRQAPEFRAAVNSILDEAKTATRNKLIHAGSLALDVLCKIMSSPTASDRDKLAAAAQVLNIVAPTPANPGPTTGREIIQAEAQQAQAEQLWASLL